MQKNNNVSATPESEEFVVEKLRPFECDYVLKGDGADLLFDKCLKELGAIDDNLHLIDEVEGPPRIFLTLERLFPNSLQLLMERYGFDGCHFAVKAPLYLYATGRLTGVVLHSGYFNSTIVPILEGNPITELYKRPSLGGLCVTRKLARLLRLSGYFFNLGKV